MASNLSDSARQIIQRCFEGQPVMVLGSGASVPHGLPTMKDLSEYLKANVQPVPAEQNIWKNIVAKLESGEDVEAVLDAVQRDSDLLQKIVESTWVLIEAKDRDVFENNQGSATSKILFRLAETSGRRVDVVTTNYDRLAEYAAEHAGLLWFDGFGPGFRRSLWSDGIPVIRRSMASGVPAEPTVAIWKVHGSLDWFEDPQGNIVSIPLRTAIPSRSLPLIITPGRSKFERTHSEPFRSIVAEADAAMKRAGGAICIGYGFNDTHVQEKLKARRSSQSFVFVVVARSLTPATKRFLFEETCKNFVAIESIKDANGNVSTTECCVCTADAPAGERTKGLLWHPEAFASEVL